MAKKLVCIVSYIKAIILDGGMEKEREKGKTLPLIYTDDTDRKNQTHHGGTETRRRANLRRNRTAP